MLGDRSSYLLSYRFRWVFCQLEVLRHCLPASIRQTLDRLPETLDETYARVLSQIPQANQAHAHRMLQCLMVAIRPLRVEELAEVLAFEFDTAQRAVPRYRADWRPNDQVQAMLSICSSLIAIVDYHGSQVVQFSHFSVKEFLMSDRLTSSLGDFPLTKYAAQHWVTHAQFENVASRVKDGMESLFDCDKPHFAAWVGIHDIDEFYLSSSTIPTPLYYSSLCGFSDLVQHLAMKRPQDVNAVGGQYDFPLLAALHGKHIQVAAILLKHGANVDIYVYGARERWPAPFADVDMLQFLLNHGADVNFRRDDHCTPLHLAVYYRKLEGARVLLEHNANVNSLYIGGMTPLHLQLESSRVGWSDPVAAYGVEQADPVPVLARLLLEHGADVNTRADEWTLLHLAAFDGEHEVARMLLDHGANVNVVNEQGDTPLYLMSGKNDLPRDCTILDRTPGIVLRCGVDADVQAKYGWTPLHLAAFEGWLETARVLLFFFFFKSTCIPGPQVLLDHGANADAENDQGMAPLHIVSQGRFLFQASRSAVAQLLLERGAGTNSQTKHKWTPLHWATFLGRLKIAQVLLDHGANVNAENEQGETPLHLLVAQGGYDRQASDVAFAKLLLVRGADTNAQDKAYATPFYLACHHGKRDIVAVLLSYRAKVHIESDSDLVPWHPGFEGEYSSHEQCFSITHCLLEHSMGRFLSTTSYVYEETDSFFSKSTCEETDSDESEALVCVGRKT